MLNSKRSFTILLYIQKFQGSYLQETHNKSSVQQKNYLEVQKLKGMVIQ